MNDNKIRKNQGYLLRRPENSLCCFVLASDFDLKTITESQLKRIEELKENGYDLFFIYLPREENTRIWGPSRVKFTSLEEAKGFIDLGMKSELGYAEIFKAIDYVTKTTSDFYTGYTLIHLRDLNIEKDITPEMKSLGDITKLDIVLPVLEIQRVEWMELKEGWKTISPEYKPKCPWWLELITNFDNPFHSHTYTSTIEELETGEDLYQEGMFATHTSSTIFPFYRPRFFNELLEKFRDEKNLQWLNTFSLKENPRTVISSTIKFFGLGWLDRNPLNINLTKQKI